MRLHTRGRCPTSWGSPWAFTGMAVLVALQSGIDAFSVPGLALRRAHPGRAAGLRGLKATMAPPRAGTGGGSTPGGSYPYNLPAMKQKISQNKFLFYDTTLRDGAQGEGISLSCDDKLRIAAKLHDFGAHYIEGGWPGSNPKDAEFFQRAKVELQPAAWAKVAAFGSTRYKGLKVEEDKQVAMLVDSGAKVITLVGKAWDLHVDVVLETTHEENVAMIRDTVAYLKGLGREVMLDAEHYFDGCKANHDYALECLGAAVDGGVDWLVLCDTNGASLPWEIQDMTREVRFRFPQTNVGVHCHNDQGMAVANSIASVQGGAGLIQGTINGYGERTGNANVMSILPTLELKMGYEGVGKHKLVGLTGLSRYVDEQANQPTENDAAYVGSGAFAVREPFPRAKAAPEGSFLAGDIDPSQVGNLRGGVAETSGKEVAGKLGGYLAKYSTEKLRESADKVLAKVRDLEERGYFLGLAEASIDLMIRRTLPGYAPPFETLDYHVTVWDDQPGQYGSSGKARATVKVKVGQEFVNRYLVKELRKLGDLAADPASAANMANKMAEEMNRGGAVMLEVAEGNGPVNALSMAMVKALLPLFPSLEMLELTDYKVRIIDNDAATAAVTRVMIEFQDKQLKTTWTTISSDTNIMSASFNALVDGFEHHLNERESYLMPLLDEGPAPKSSY